MKDLFIYNNYIMSSFVTIILQGSFKESCYVRVLESFKGSKRGVKKLPKMDNVICELLLS